MHKEHAGGVAAPAQLAEVPGAGGAAVVLAQGAGTAGHPVPAVAGGARHSEQCLTLGQPFKLTFLVKMDGGLRLFSLSQKNKHIITNKAFSSVFFPH